MENLNEALKQRIKDRESKPVPPAIKGLPDQIEAAKAITGLPPEK